MQNIELYKCQGLEHNLVQILTPSQNGSAYESLHVPSLNPGTAAVAKWRNLKFPLNVLLEETHEGRLLAPRL